VTYGSAEGFLDGSHPDDVACLILDVRMDGMSGLDLYDRLRAAGNGTPPVIFITAHDDAVTRRRIDHSDAIAFLPKPFEMTTLLSAVGRAIGRDLLRATG